LSGLRSYALDSSFLIYHYFKQDDKTERILELGFINPVVLSETFYVLCRKVGLNNALSFVAKVSKEVKTAPLERLIAMAGQFKCKYPLSIVDCWVLATSRALSIPALFAFKEKELLVHLDELGEEVEIQFLDEIAL
jgi:predicted nucleic acid-binding protein